jgi:hypothetical protein
VKDPYLTRTEASAFAAMFLFAALFFSVVAWIVT